MTSTPLPHNNRTQQLAHTFRVVQLTDLHLLADAKARYRGANTRAHFLTALALTQRLKPNLLLLTGDLAEDEQLATYQWLYKQLTASGLAWQWLPGNHDNPSLMRQFSPSHFHQQTPHWQIVGLNSHLPNHTQGRLAPQELALLQQALNNPKPLLLALHHPPVSVNSQWKDAIALENAAEFWAKLKHQPQARLVVFGHVHQAFASKNYHSHTLATPASSVQFTADSNTFAISQLALPALRLIRLKPAGRYSTRLIYFKI